ncbi:MAG TPA: TonB-dependent receptor [Candidatus Eisenbacteria bacterium]|nr:TonB-dependent receptor [Candidatus Eisenbacteria bacterium]
MPVSCTPLPRPHAEAPRPAIVRGARARAGPVALALLVTLGGSPAAPFPARADAPVAPAAADTALTTTPEAMPQDLTQVKLEDLMNLEVRSVSRHEERLAETASAVTVLGPEDIAHSGATSLAGLLRLVPGLEVAQIDAGTWAVSARGFNQRFANKLLVLVDGRSVYSPWFSGVFWDVQQVPVEDIERIEVIRGPGASVWGVNAVNGVINIVTREARDTPGTLVAAGGGTAPRGYGLLQRGGASGDLAWRVYGSGVAQTVGDYPGNLSSARDTHAEQGGFRTDWDRAPHERVTLEGQLLTGETPHFGMITALTPPGSPIMDYTTINHAANLVARWERSLSPTSQLTVQTYYDHVEREDEQGRLLNDAVDLDAQQHVEFGRHELVWGGSWRWEQLDSRPTFTAQFFPDNRAENILSGFAQDELRVVPDRLRLTLGSKVEHDTDSGTEFQPSGRLLWTPSGQQSVWAAVSRAVHTPSRLEQDLRANVGAFPGPGGTPVLVSVFGNPDERSEVMVANELGWRLQPSPRAFVEAAAFFNSYDRLRTIEPAAMYPESLPAPYHFVAPQRFANLMDGDSYGTEVSAEWTPAAGWRLHADYTWLRERLRLEPGSQDVGDPATTGDQPQHQASLRARWAAARTLDLDASLHYTSRLANQPVPAYTRLDLHTAWRPAPHLELSVLGANLLQPRHDEFVSLAATTMVSTHLDRSVFAKLTWRQ